MMRKKWTLIAAAVVVGSVLVLGGLLLVFGGKESAAPADVVAPPARPAPSTAQPDDAPSGEQGLPVEGPAAQWSLVGRVAVPDSTEAGPRSQGSPAAEGYQRSPVGALIAAWNINTRMLLTPGDGWREVVDRQVLDGPGKEAFIKARSTVTDPSLGDNEAMQVAGFRFVTYDINTAVIQFASKSGTGALMGSTVTVRWVDGDWRLELQPNGSASSTVTPLKDLSFYTPWSGV
ncbi:hypothetical protein [Saccharopolyspora pogona]|uniref:hypothetical protein n=1 Tax=Saccharopolyspora pogona TaxID=333966 RepID=UPI001682F10B|nr:hypothetical protein [Saccharopolyspora pogona]